MTFFCNYLVTRSLRSLEGESGSFFGFAEKRTTFPSLARAKRARDVKNAFRLCPSLK
ncbi:MAG: hypothetical protein U5L45_04295 [Saprospiraceae bacterium]|nr:hypothetical protein [Saprospiraceae bacterium]